MDQLFTYLGYAVSALTVLDALLESAKSWAASTASSTDDEAVSKAAAVLDALHKIVSHASLFRGKHS